jgi:hypothetical protein
LLRPGADSRGASIPSVFPLSSVILRLRPFLRFRFTRPRLAATAPAAIAAGTGHVGAKACFALARIHWAHPSPPYFRFPPLSSVYVRLSVIRFTRSLLAATAPAAIAAGTGHVGAKACFALARIHWAHPLRISVILRFPPFSSVKIHKNSLQKFGFVFRARAHTPARTILIGGTTWPPPTTRNLMPPDRTARHNQKYFIFNELHTFDKL